LSVVYELFKGRENTDFAYKNMTCSVFRNFNIISFTDDLSTGLFLVSITDERKKTTEMGAIGGNWTEIFEG
jgi:hypothetical protein